MTEILVVANRTWRRELLEGNLALAQAVQDVSFRLVVPQSKPQAS